MVAEAVAVRHHAHIDARHDRHSRRFLFVRGDSPLSYEFLDVFPIRNNEAVKLHLAFENIGKQMLVSVSGNAVDLGGIYHHGASTSFDGSFEWGKEIFAKVIF